MRAKKGRFNGNAKKGGVLLAAGLLATQRLMAGSVLISQPPIDTTPQVVLDDQANDEMNVFAPAKALDAIPAALLEYGDVTLHPHVTYSFSYGSGIQSSINNSRDTIVQELSPGLTADLGKHWVLDYTPTLQFYSNKEFHNNVGQAASLTGATRYEDWNFGLSQSFSSTSTPTTETAAQTDQQSYSTALTAGYAFADKWSADFSLGQNFSLVSAFQDSYAWTASGGVNYQFSPRLSAGISTSSGYTIVSENANSVNGQFNNPDSVNESLSFNVGWRATDKISLQASVGVQDQEFLASGYGNSLSPIFSGSIQYQPFKVTQISLTASRSTSPSDYYVSAQTSEDTVVSLSVSQRILVKYHLTLGLSYSKMDFTSTYTQPGYSGIIDGITYIVPGYSVNTVRSDNDYSFNASFGRGFLTHGNWAITYQYIDNESSIAGYSQRSNQIGFQVGFSY